ncbi:hypothetical protein ALC60_11931 [Trachymyrmex zeteki]|uniref:Uncharacterized protein n=1 Tax=Mycetomoellerius zeteki TaxID=64791 RepID=A0A151WM34_9HYME|nr:hypothetical protein ALC60_11931 [Trachymyrmex zeteki]
MYPATHDRHANIARDRFESQDAGFSLLWSDAFGRNVGESSAVSSGPLNDTEESSSPRADSTARLHQAERHWGRSGSKRDTDKEKNRCESFEILELARAGMNEREQKVKENGVRKRERGKRASVRDGGARSKVWQKSQMSLDLLVRQLPETSGIPKMVPPRAPWVPFNALGRDLTTNFRFTCGRRRERELAYIRRDGTRGAIGLSHAR